MKISFIAENDWANVLTEYSYCLNKHSKDIEAKSICLNKHSFNYTIQHDYDISVCSEKEKQEAQQFLQDSDVIIFGEEGAIQPTNYKILEIYKQILGIDLLNSNKKLLIWHPGSHYRQNSSFYNNHPLRDKIYKHLYAIDLYRLSNKEKNDSPLLPYQYSNFDTKVLLASFINKLDQNHQTILHIPSNPIQKRTEEITNSVNNLNLQSKYNYKVLTNIPHTEVIKEKRNSLFYIDQFSPHWGGYGIASLEALFNSNIVFCTVNNCFDSIVKITGKDEIPIVDLSTDPNNMSGIISQIISLTNEDLIELYSGILGWLDDYYQPKKIISHIKNIINE
tara:strand:- start:10729 stop:11733 length:1005 start_codon:yes stop_codon:yes gene_type:complete